MINKLDIGHFGCYHEHEWKEELAKQGIDRFKKVNIIYGRNYSGKTTLSRIFRCLEEKQPHEHYQNSRFTFYLESGHQIHANTLDQVPGQLRVRVYNSDFIRDNLSWFYSPDGTIRPFTILGSDNVDIQRQIQAIDSQLGSRDEGTGLLGLEMERDKKYNALRLQHKTLTTRIDDALREKAQKIKLNTGIYADPTYNISDIRKELNYAKQFGVLPSSLIEDKKKVLKEEPKPELEQVSVLLPDIKSIYQKASNLLEKKLIPSKPIEELIHNHLLEKWVRNGMELHRDQRTTCGFCGSDLPPDLWDRLNAHFGEESESLRVEIEKLISEVANIKNLIKNIITLNRAGFYSHFQQELDNLWNQWKNEIDKLNQELTSLTSRLNERLSKIFKTVSWTVPEDQTETLTDIISKFNVLIDGNNSKTQTLSDEQSRIRKELRYSEIAELLEQIRYDSLVQQQNELKAKVDEQERLLEETRSQIRSLQGKKEKLHLQLRDESRGAARVNEYLQRYFRHDQIGLVADHDGGNTRFKVMRSNTEAKSLSEGESRLVSFCYFMAKIEDELQNRRTTDKLIIFIDDPISSLDSNHIFFVFSLIDSIIARREQYTQLFISTHNLDFLKYLKKLTLPKKEKAAYLITERLKKGNDTRCFLRKLPTYLQDYVTEFHYLFSEIYKVYQSPSETDTTYSQFYNLPNNLRKFLECYIFFRYPNLKNPLKHLDKLFDETVLPAVNRVINEYSHLSIERAVRPTDDEEIKTCVQLVIEAIKKKDPDHFNALVDSIDQGPQTGKSSKF